MNTTVIEPEATAYAACREVGIYPDRITAVRIRDNGIMRAHFSNGATMIVRVHRAIRSPRASVELSAATYLAASGIPVPRPVHPEVVWIGDQAVSLLDDLGDNPPATGHDVGALLRALHSVPVPGNIGLRPFDPFSGFPARLAAAQIDDATRNRISLYVDQTHALWDATDFGTPVLIHGDAGAHNTIAAPSGPHLIDLETLAIGPAAYDTATGTFDRLLFGASPTFEEEFATGYGTTTDPDDPAYKVIHRVRMLSCLLFVLRHRDKPEARAEADHRLNDFLTDTPLPWHWSAL